MKQPVEAEPEILDLRELQPDAAPAGKVYTPGPEYRARERELHA